MPSKPWVILLSSLGLTSSLGSESLLSPGRKDSNLSARRLSLQWGQTTLIQLGFLSRPTYFLCSYYLIYLIVHFLSPSRMYTSQWQASFCLVYSMSQCWGMSLGHNRHSEMSTEWLLEWMNEWMTPESLTVLTTALTLRLAFCVNSQDNFLCWNLIFSHLKRMYPKHHKHTFRNIVLASFRTYKAILFFLGKKNPKDFVLVKFQSCEFWVI